MTSHNLIKNVLIIIVLISILLPSDLFSQFQTDPVRVIPKSPESASFDQYLNVPVSLATGVPQISIPLYTISLDGLEIPVSISYHASGVKVDDIATPIGLNWVLNAGGRVSRTIIGVEDANANGWIGTSVPNPDYCIDRDDLVQYYGQENDLAPDIYTYTIPGAIGSFFYTTNGDILKTTVDDIIFTDSLNIWDSKGNHFKFKNGDFSFITIENNCFPMTIDCLHFIGNGITTWHLENITTPTDDTIKFSYTPHSFSTPNVVTKYEYVRLTPNPFYGTGVDTDTIKTWTTTSYSTNIISKIETKKEKIEFFYDTDNDASIMQKRLNKIEITELINGNKIKTIKFIHGHYQGDPCLRLDTLRVSGTDTSKCLTYCFDYHSGSLQSYGSYKRDIFGFHNDNTKYHMIPRCEYADTTYFAPDDFADREIDTSRIQYGVLTKITYPTGGSVKYTYEVNKETINNINYFASGLRVKQIEYLDKNNALIKKENFTYYGLISDKIHTEGMFTNHYFKRGLDDVTPQPLYSEMKWSSIAIPTSEFIKKDYYGFYYETVIKKISDGINNTGYTESNFNGYYDNFNLSPYNIEENIYDENDKLVKKTSYSYSIDTTRIQALGLDLSYNYWGLYFDCDGNSIIKSGVDGTSIKQYYNNLQKSFYTSTEFLKTETKIVDYFNNESDSSVIKNRDYYEIITYEGVDCLLKTGNSNYNFFGNDSTLIDSTATKYVKDYTFTGFPSELEDSLIIGKPIDVRQYKQYNNNVLLTAGKTTEYNKYGKPTKEYLWEGADPSAESWSDNELLSGNGGFNEKIIYEYDSLSHKLISSTLTDNITTTFIWGYDNNYPIAKVENASSDEVYHTSYEDSEGVLNQGKLKTGKKVKSLSSPDTIPGILIEGDYIMSYFWRSTESSEWELQIQQEHINTLGETILTDKSSGHIDELRVYPIDAMMTTYTFDPLIGITSSTDPGNSTTYYLYDSFGQLRAVKDGKGNILKAYRYHYADQEQ